MCLAVPGRVLSVRKGLAVVDFGARKLEARTDLVKPKKGDSVLVFKGHVIEICR